MVAGIYPGRTEFERGAESWGEPGVWVGGYTGQFEIA